MAAQRFRIAAWRGFEWQRHCESTSMLYQLLLSLKVPPQYKVCHMPAPIFQGAQVVVMTSEKPDLFCNPVFTPWLSPAILCHLDKIRSQKGCGRQTACGRLWKANCLKRKWLAENREIRAKEAVKSKVVFKKKGLVNVFNSSLYRFLAKPSAPTSSRVTRSSPRSTRIRSDKHRYTIHCAEN